MLNFFLDSVTLKLLSKLYCLGLDRKCSLGSHEHIYSYLPSDLIKIRISILSCFQSWIPVETGKEVRLTRRFQKWRNNNPSFKLLILPWICFSSCVYISFNGVITLSVTQIWNLKVIISFSTSLILRIQSTLLSCVSQPCPFCNHSYCAKSAFYSL